MGAQDFMNLERRQGESDTMRDAFRRAVDQAAWDYGHAGYTGTIAEKGEVYLIQNPAPLPYEAAEKMAYDLIDSPNCRAADKWGPAGAIPVSLPDRRIEVTGFDFLPTRGHGYNGPDPALLAAVTAVLKKKRLLRRGETVASVSLSSYTFDERGRTRTLSNCRAEVTVAKAKNAPATVDGWLFFGVASS